MAQETGVTEATLSRFVRGERGLDLSSVDKLAAYLGLSLVNMGQHGKGQGGER
jgi:transcriptional regulator with XRE-family HTH domain